MTATLASFDERYPTEWLTERQMRLRRFWAGTGTRTALTVHHGSFPYRQIEDDATIVEHAVQTILTSADLSPD